MKTRQRFWSLRLEKQWILVGLLGLSLLTGCATPSQNPYLYTGAGLGAAPGGRHRGRRQSQQPLEGGGYRRLLGAAGGGIAGEVYGRSQTPYQPQQQGYYQPPQQGNYPPQQQGYYQPQQGNYQPAPYYGPPPS